MNIAAIIPAAGAGSRAGFAENKIFQKIGGVPVLLRSVRAFTRREDIGAVAVCAAEGELARVRELLAGEPKAAVVAGGDTRTASVRAALEYFAALPCPPDYVLVHDAARPFVSQEVIGGCIACTRSHGSGVCALPCTDTLAKGQFGMIASFYERGSAYAVQTPQGFGFTELLRAYRSIGADENFTDDSGVYAKYIAPPFLCGGEAKNRKLTFAEDFMEIKLRTGIGVDTHQFGADADHIVLGGARIPAESGLVAHSDGDVLCHALMDALLSAAGLPDIGQQFPDTDPQYAGADSLQLLRRVRETIEAAGFAAENVSASILAEQPKLAPYILQMKENIARALGIGEDAVGIAAGTNEGLGYIGRGEGITVVANVLLRGI